jgi:hypothetical protein
MTPKDPEFYLTSSEGYNLQEIRTCKRIRRFARKDRDDLLLIEIDPPIIGQQFGLGARDIHRVVVTPRHVGYTLFPVNSWPAYVHVARLLIDECEIEETLDVKDLELIAWAELYPDLESAEKAVSTYPEFFRRRLST